MSPSVWNSLGEENQKIINEAMAEVEISERELSRQMEQEALETLQSEGMNITYPDKAEFISATQSVRDEYGKDYADILSRVETAK